jgi:glutamate-1-semialdehyde aminotransferase/acyl carrier protein
MVEHGMTVASPLERVRQIVTDLTGATLGPADDDTPFAQLGMDSLALTQLAGAVTRALGHRVTLRQVSAESPTVRALAARFPASSAATAPAVAAPPMARHTAPVRRANEGMSATPGVLPPDVREVFERQLEIMTAQVDAIARVAGERPPEVAPSPMPAPASRPVAVAEPVAAAEPAPVPAPASSAFGAVRRGPFLPTPHQRLHIDALVRDTCAKTPSSKQLAARYRTVHADPRSAAGFHPLWKEMAYPLAVARSEGAYLWDVDGHAYVDLLNGFGPGLLGHRHPAIVQALETQLSRGFEVGPMSPLAGEAADLVCRLTGMERATFVCTGSEAVQAAMRAARTTTGRDVVVTFARDYHGNFDEVLVHAVPGVSPPRSMPSAPGIPAHAAADMVVLPYGTEQSLDIVRQLGDRVAAVLVEPVQSRRPEFQPREFLVALRALTREIGAVLIFDEIVTGFRLQAGGAQAWYGIEADLATYGKVLGGGMPVGVVAGRRPFMDVFDGGPWQFGDASAPEADVTFFAGTFVRHPLVLAAVTATLRHLEAAGPAFYTALNARTDAFVRDIQADLDANAMPFIMTNCGSLCYLRGTVGHPMDPLLHAAMRHAGVYVLDGFPSYLTAAHDDAVLTTVRQALHVASERLLDGALVAMPAVAVR